MVIASSRNDAAFAGPQEITMPKSLNKLALAGALTLALSGAFAGFAEARGGGGGGGGGNDITANSALVMPDTPRRPRGSVTNSGPDGCHYSTYWGGIVCEQRGGRR
jgi:hypothetical protein